MVKFDSVPFNAMVSIRSTPENMMVLKGKQKVLLGGKQLKDNA